MAVEDPSLDYEYKCMNILNLERKAMATAWLLSNGNDVSLFVPGIMCVLYAWTITIVISMITAMLLYL